MCQLKSLVTLKNFGLAASTVCNQTSLLMNDFEEEHPFPAYYLCRQPPQRHRDAIGDLVSSSSDFEDNTAEVQRKQ